MKAVKMIRGGVYVVRGLLFEVGTVHVVDDDLAEYLSGVTAIDVRGNVLPRFEVSDAGVAESGGVEDDPVEAALASDADALVPERRGRRNRGDVSLDDLRQGQGNV